MKRSARYSLTAGVLFMGILAALSPLSRGAEPDAGAGKDVFDRRCSGCHAADSSKEGPPLRGVVGRKAGTVSGFLYSDSLRASGITWNEGLLMKWLENPDVMVKGTDMEFRVPKAEEREAVIAYLKSLTR
jgi:cytochrome c